VFRWEIFFNLNCIFIFSADLKEACLKMCVWVNHLSYYMMNLKYFCVWYESHTFQHFSMFFWSAVSIFLLFMYHVIVSTCAQCDQSIYISVVYYALSAVYSMIYQSTYQLCACCRKSSHSLWLLTSLALLYEYIFRYEDVMLIHEYYQTIMIYQFI